MCRLFTIVSTSFIFFSGLLQSSALVRLVSRSGEALAGVRTWESAEYLHYGPLPPGARAPFIVLNDDELCDPEQRKQSVAGLVVIAANAGHPCLVHDIYAELSLAGAAAFVNRNWYNPPGLFLHQHRNTPFMRCEFCGKPMALVEIGDPNNDLVSEARRHSSAWLEIIPSHSKEYLELFSSAAWATVVRVLAPMLALRASYEAARYISSTGASTSKLTIGRIILMVEGFSMVFVALALMLGQFGPTMLNLRIHGLFQNLLSGSFTFTALAMGMFLREEQRHEELHVPRRNVLKLNRNILGASFITLGLCDFVLSIAPVEVHAALSYIAVPIVYSAVLSPIQLAASLYFLVQAFRFKDQLLFYLMGMSPRGQVVGPLSTSVRRIGRLAFWLAVSGILAITSCVSFVVNMVRFTQKGLDFDPHAYFVLTAVFVFTRIGASFAHIRALLPDKTAVSVPKARFFRTRRVNPDPKQDWNPNAGSSDEIEMRDTYGAMTTVIEECDEELKEEDGNP